jgi:hypothetical protein
MDAKTINPNRKARRNTEAVRAGEAKRSTKAQIRVKTVAQTKPGAPAGNWRSYYFVIAALVIYAVFQVYGPALRGPFVYDDFSLPFYNPYFPTASLSAWITGVRPLLMFSYWANFQLSGRNPFSYHVANLLFHLANSVAIYLIARRILSWETLEKWRREILAGFAGLLFLMHPVQTESVAWIAGRSESLSVLFFLYAFTVFLYRPSGPIGWLRSIFVLALFACAAATKEHTATLPLILVLTDLYSSRENRIQALRQNWRLYLPMAAGALVAGAFIWRVVSTSKSAGFSGAGVSWASYALTQCRVFYMYLRLFLFPAGQNIDYDVPWTPVRFDPVTLVCFIGIAALGFFAWKLRRRFPVASYGFFVFLILLAPTSSFIPIKDPIVERRLYLPMIGLVLIACEFMIHAIRERTAAISVAALILVAASIATYQRNHVWGSEAALWDDTVSKSPKKVRGYIHLVHGLVTEHRCREALARLDDWSHHMPIDPMLLEHWAFAYECVKEPERALEKLQLSAAQLPSATTYVNIARNQVALKREPDAMQSLNKAVEMDPRLESAYLIRGQLYEGERNLTAAVTDYRQALAIEPRNEWLQRRLQEIGAQ